MHSTSCLVLCLSLNIMLFFFFFFFQAEDGIRDRSPSRGLEMCIRDRTTGVSDKSGLAVKYAV